MARGLNKVMIVGNLGKGVEMKYTGTGKAVANFSVAVNNSRKQADGSYTEETEWFRVVAWDKLAETCNQYLNKGSKVYCEGRLTTRKWTDAQGAEHYTTELILSDMLMLGDKPAGGAARPAGLAANQTALDEDDVLF